MRMMRYRFHCVISVTYITTMTSLLADVVENSDLKCCQQHDNLSRWSTSGWPNAVGLKIWICLRDNFNQMHFSESLMYILSNHDEYHSAYLCTAFKCSSANIFEKRVKTRGPIFFHIINIFFSRIR